MKAKTILNALSVIFISGSIILTSCDNNSDENLALSDADIDMAEDNTAIDAVYEEIQQTVDQEISTLDQNGYQDLHLKSTSDDICRIVTVDRPDSTRFPKVVTIDYGDGCTNVVNGDTITKKGIIEITVTGRYFIAGSQRIITFKDFFINNMQIEGTRSITNNGYNDNGNLEFSIKLEEGKVTIDDTIVITRNSSRVREWYIGNRWDRGDDEYIITGSTYGVNARGENYSREIIEPLHKTSCRFFVSGIIESVVGTNDPVQLDYGEGFCDNIASLSRNGETKEIRLRFWHRNRWRKHRNQ